LKTRTQKGKHLIYVSKCEALAIKVFGQAFFKKLAGVDRVHGLEKSPWSYES